ncbi:DUF1062 domain-containing protein [Frigidibacter sp. SD6-1]|uniref:DUF1062 domain-containing protein n=1 Tax=Frigidibacter sp. SD6-1 TaxID=3032581 RepID=UPI0024DFB926|nr:DUF1062 domain-containing protein [Frigidibacter sp. SD6-1]
MAHAARILWTLHPADTPCPRRHCPGCGTARAFRSSGRIRLNANGRRLDAWLIYRCTICERTWNRPIFERMARDKVPATMIAACEMSDPHLVARLERDMTALGKLSGRIEGGLPLVAKRCDVAAGAATSGARVRIVGAAKAPCRLDRLLARELGLSRAGVASLVGAGVLALEGSPQKAMVRQIVGDIVLLVRPSGLPEVEGAALLAALGPQPG